MIRPIIRRRSLRTRFGLCGLIQIHHIIPKQWTTHPTVVASEYNIDAPYNLMFLPTDERAHDTMFLSSDRLFHSGGHPRYNLHVKRPLDDLEGDYHDAVRHLARDLRRGIRHNPRSIPWRAHHEWQEDDPDEPFHAERSSCADKNGVSSMKPTLDALGRGGGGK
jgi:hypothetical protein